MSEIISNEAFITGWNSGEIRNALLEKEVSLVSTRLQEIESALENLVEQKISVSGGDDWHDGQFRATDAAAQNLYQQFRPLEQAKGWPRVQMPRPDSQIASIGSRVNLLQNGSLSYSVDLVGMILLHNYGNDDDLVVTSINSPLGNSLIGRALEEEYETQFGVGNHILKVVGITSSLELNQVGTT